MKLPVVLLVLGFATAVAAQTCDNSDVSQVIHSDITTDNGGFVNSITLSGDAAVTADGVDLTTTQAGSFGGFFLDAPTAFAGDGGFSAKFAFQATGGSGGEAWEFIVADGGSRQILSAPFGPGAASNGLAGWSRSNAMVIEFDALDSSGTNEQDKPGTGNHVAIYVGGVKVCQSSVGFSFANGNIHYIWVDFAGFIQTMEVRLATSNSRPASATVQCGVDMWSTLSIEPLNNFIGFSAYNAVGSAGALHSLREVISITDAYRPEDTKGQCAYYAECKLRTVSSLCTNFLGNGQCSFEACPPVYMWTVGGDSCCAFVEKASYRATGPAYEIVAGGTTTCERQRVTTVYETEARNCAGIVSTLVTTAAPTTAAVETSAAFTVAARTTAAGTAVSRTTVAASTTTAVVSTVDEGFRQ
jgi:Legume lectin domain